MKQSTFIAALKFASQAMATKDPRYYLNGVLFEFRGSTLTLVGTDGNVMAYVEVANDAGQHDCEDFIVPADTVKLMLTVFKGKSTGEVTFEWDGQNGFGVRGGSGQVIQCVLVKGKYPDWRRVCRSGRPTVPTERFGVSTKYMAAAGKACGDLSTSALKGMTVNMYGATDAIVCKPDKLPDGVGEAAMIVMLMRNHLGGEIK